MQAADVRTSVKVTNPDHPHFGRAGVIATAELPDGSIGVKLDALGDTPEVTEAIPLADLIAL